MSYWVLTSSFVPFNDHTTFVSVTNTATSSNPPMDTEAYNNLRQGIELRNIADLYQSNQPKFWGGDLTKTGSITHEQEFKTYGQAVSFVEFFGKPGFEDRENLNMITYLLHSYEGRTVVMLNGGPQFQQEAMLEPLTIYDRLPGIEGNTPAHQIYSNLETGNALEGKKIGNSLVEQFTFKSLSNDLKSNPFLDYGEKFIGTTITGSIKIPGYRFKPQEKAYLYIDTSNNFDVLSEITSYQSSSSDFEFVSASNNLKFITNDLRPYGKKSTTAGFISYGRTDANTGTDSVAYIGWTRGS